MSPPRRAPPSAADGPQRPGRASWVERGAAALVRIALVAYPGAFRREMGPALVGDVRRRVRDLGPWRALAWTPRLTRSLLVNAVGAWRERRGRGERGTGPGGQFPEVSGRGGGGPRSISWLDAKLGVRMLFKHPGLTLASVVGIAVAVGLGAGFFSFMQAHFYPTIPLAEGDRLVGLENWDLERNNEERRSLYDFALWRSEMRTIEDLTAFRRVSRNLIGADGDVDLVEVAQMTPSGFDLARVPPFRGRYLVEGDAAADAAPVLVVGYDAWQARFGGDPDVVGTDVRLGNVPHTVVGIMPPDFSFPVSDQFWTPLPVDPSTAERGGGPNVFIAGRLAPGVEMEEAQAELAVIGARMATEFPETHGRFRAQLMPYAYPILDINQKGSEGFLWEFLAMAAMGSGLLLVVCANVAVLVYARTAARRGELAVRAALGASRARVVIQLFVEALVLSAVGAAAGLLVARVGIGLGVEIMKTEMGDTLPFWMDTGTSAAGVLYVAVLAVVAAVAIGVLPALRVTGRDVQEQLREVSGGTGRGMGRTWTGLIMIQVAVSVVALPVAMLVAWSQVREHATVPGYDPGELATAWLYFESEPPLGESLEAYVAALPGRYEELRRELSARLEAEPGVASFAFSGERITEGIPARVAFDDDTLAAPDRSVRAVAVGPAGLTTLDLPLVAGRSLEPRDYGEGAPEVVVVDERFADRFSRTPGGVLGRRIRFPTAPGAGRDEPVEPGPRYEIVGVIGSVYRNPVDPSLVVPRVYRPMAFGAAGPLRLTVRAAGGDADPLPGTIRRTVAELAPTVRVSVRTFDELRRQDVTVVRLVGLGIGLSVLSVLLLAAAGIYALMSFTIVQRHREIGVRTALGAPRMALLGSVLFGALRQLGRGVVLGVAAFVAVDLLVVDDPLLMGRGAAVLAFSVALMAGVGLLATVGPARRGLAIQPAEVLKSE